MRKALFALTPFFGISSVVFLCSCNKEDANTPNNPSGNNNTNNLLVLSTTPISAITSITAISGGNITSKGSSVITSRGVCWSSSPSPTVSLSTKTNEGPGTDSFTSSLAGLSPATTYYVRAYATNSAGTAYGNQIIFTTANAPFEPGGGVTDIDGNNYQTIILGNQEWMKENLKTSKYRNGDPITTNLSDIDWQYPGGGACAIYKNNSANNITYGKLYNWYAVSDPRGLCPAGWHVPTDHEWQLLTKYLDPSADTACGPCSSSSTAGGKMKSTGTIQAGTGLWNDPNTAADNSSGFTGLPGGSRADYGSFIGIGGNGAWWSSTENASTFAWYRILVNFSGNLVRNDFSKRTGFSVRCVLD